MSSDPAGELDLEAIGEAFRLARKNAGRDQTAVAAAVGTHQATLSRIERGLETNVSAQLLHRIALEFGFAVTVAPVFRREGKRAAALGVAS